MTIEALSRIMENTAFISDLILYIPDLTKSFLKNNEWNTMLRWSLGFCRQIPFLDVATEKLFYLVRRNCTSKISTQVDYHKLLVTGCPRIEYC